MCNYLGPHTPTHKNPVHTIPCCCNNIVTHVLLLLHITPAPSSLWLRVLHHPKFSVDLPLGVQLVQRLSLAWCQTCNQSGRAR